MADNVAITAGSGTTVAADDIAGVMHQRIKVSLGADGSATDALGGAGAVAAGVQRVTLASDDPAVVALTAAATSLPHVALDSTNDLTHAFVTSSSSGEQDMVAATAAQTIRLHRFTITAEGATVVEFRDGAGGAALKTIVFPAPGAYTYDFDPRPYTVSTVNTKLVRNSTNAVKVTVDFEYKKS
jgi:hypothetical protein